MMKKMLFFVNPAAGKEEMRFQLMDVIDYFTANGYDVLCHPTQKPLDIPEFLQARGEEFDMVVTCGGDGTLNETVSGLISGDGILEITVAGNNDAQCGRILSELETSTEDEANARCYSASMEDVENAHEAGLSLGKYRVFLEVQALDPDITPEEVQGMTMREIQELVQQLTGEEPATQTEHADETSSGHGHGQGGGRHGQ